MFSARPICLIKVGQQSTRTHSWTGFASTREYTWVTWRGTKCSHLIKTVFNYYSWPIKIYRPIVSWQWLLWNLVWIMKHWLLLNSILMGVANIVGRISYKLLGRALSWMLKAGVRSIYSINLTSSYFSISFIGNSQICWCGKHYYDLDLYELILIYKQTFQILKP